MTAMVEDLGAGQNPKGIPVPLDGEERSAGLHEKWREATQPGFVAVPNVLLTYFKSLNITPTEFLVLLNLLLHWWYVERRPFPRVSTIARRMDTTPRTVQRALNRLRAIGLIDWRLVQVRNGKILPEGHVGDGVRRRVYDLTPLADRAARLAQDRLEFLEERADRGRPTEIAA